MSIDLYVELPRPVRLRALLPEVGRVLAEMLELSAAPDLTLQVLENGRREAAVSDELRDDSSPLFLISIAGEPETVGLTVPGKNVTLVMGAQRSTLEYLLGAAIAIALSRELGGPIGDDWHLFGDEVQVSHEDLLHRLKVPDRGRSLREAAELLSSKLGKETDSD